MRVLVTGGTGLVGSAIREINPNWTYINSKHCNLLDKNAFDNYLDRNGPFDFVIHLAANVGGLFKNLQQKVKMYQDNLRMNLNVIESCHSHNVPRMICCLSTCVFPDGLNFIMDENDLHIGEPHNSNFGYAYAKRMIDIHCKLINENTNFYYQTIIPCNIYGPNDQFDNPEAAHVIPALIYKAASLQSNNKNIMDIIGTGMPVRQFIYSRDLAKIVDSIVKKNIRSQSIICAPDIGDECTILDVAKLIARNFNIKSVVPEFFIPRANDNELDEVNDKQTTCINDGQFIKTCSNKLLKKLIPDIDFTPLDEGIRQTCLWYKNNKLVTKHINNSPSTVSYI